MLWHDYGAMLHKASLSVPAYLEYRDHMSRFENVAVGADWSANLTGTGDPERLQGARVSGNFLRTLGVAPAHGRDFLDGEDRPGNNHVVIVSDALWRRRLGAGQDLAGKTLSLNGETYTVAGVLPPNFVFYRPIDLIKPIGFTDAEKGPQNHGMEYLVGFARLRRGAGLAQARAEMDGIVARLRKDFYSEQWNVTITPLLDELTGEIRPALWTLAAAVGCVLLITCANVANLLLARAAGRRQEMAVRAALGAGRRRIVRQLLTESVVLAVGGGALGVLLAGGFLRLLMAVAPAEIAGVVLGGRPVGLNGTVLAFTAAVSVATGLVFGLAPALFASRVDLNDALKREDRGRGTGGGHRLVDLFVVTQIAMALVLLVGAGLLVRSFLRLRSVDPGFRPESVLTMKVTLPATRYREDALLRSTYDAILERLAAIPGVRSAALVSNLPMSGDNWGASFRAEGYQAPSGDPGPHGDVHLVSRDYFAAMGIAVLRGRPFEARDDAAGAPPTAIVDQVLADRYWPGQDPIGRRIATTFEGSDEKPLWREIVGVVGHVKKYGLDGRVKEQYYLPASQKPANTQFLVLRAAGGGPEGLVPAAGHPEALAPAAAAAVRAVDPDLPVFQVKTMQDVIGGTLTIRRFSLLLLGLFAALALCLAAVGLYAMMAYAVGQRTREIGVRMALGADARAIVRMILRRGMTLAGIGLCLGALAAVAVSRFIASLLFGVDPTDPLTFVAIAALLACTAAVASLLPALRAARVSPAEALRHQ